LTSDDGTVRRIDARVVHQDVQPTELARDGVEDLAAVLGVVRLACDGDDAALGESGGGLFKRSGLARRDAHARPFGDEPLGDREADAPARSRHDGNTA
jgi:hypothetical protein